MGRQTKLTSDISGTAIAENEDSYQVSFSRTLERGKSFTKCDGFIMNHQEFMDMVGKQNFQPKWVKVVKGADGKWKQE